MKKIFHYLLICALVQSCKSYHYYTPPPNPPTFANAGEVQFSGNFGTSGFLVKGGVALTDNLSISGMYNSAPGSTEGYFAKEYEAAAGWGFGKNPAARFSIHTGYGWGSNYDLDSGETVKDFRGNFTKPFLILNFGTARTRKIGFVRLDANMGFKFDYLMYRGSKSIYENSAYVDQTFNADHFIIEPYVMASIGGRYVRFESGMSFVFKRIQEIGKGARVFPVMMHMGIGFIINRKYEKKEPQ
ncbi:MAG: hypothetical protein ACHQF2_01055 [Flavobacteriales bacterium]